MKDKEKRTVESKMQFLTAYEVSKLLNMPLNTLYDNSKNGKIKAVKIGKKWKYKKTDIEKYIYFGTDFSAAPARRLDAFKEQSDRRSYPRINSNFECQYSIHLPPYKNVIDKGIIKNISAGGSFIDINSNEIKNIDIDDPIALVFSLVNKCKTINIRAEGRIIRKNTKGIGIMFRNMDKELKNRIIEYVG